jgi:DNA-binding beta-propeller fold protein YncE
VRDEFSFDVLVSAIATAPDGAGAYIVCFTGKQYVVSWLDFATGSLRSVFKIGTTGNKIAITPDGAIACVAGMGRQRSVVVNIMDIRSGKCRNQAKIRKSHFGDIAVTPDGTEAYITVSSKETGAVIPINLATGNCGTPINCGISPGRIVIAAVG